MNKQRIIDFIYRYQFFVSIYNNIKLNRFTKSESYKNFCKTKGKRYILINTPTYGNLGDHAITIAEQKFLKERLLNEEVLEVTDENFDFLGEKWLRKLKSEDVILFQGGGFIGSIWPKEENRLINLLNILKNNHIIIFPQTIFFDDSSFGKEEEQKFIDALSNCNHVTLFTRDNNSYDWCLSHISLNEKVKAYLVPDIVTYLNYSNEDKREDKILFCLRNDCEKVEASIDFKELANELTARQYTVQYTDTVIDGYIKSSERKYKLEEKLKEFSNSKLVITDRLHGMLFAAITGTPCIALDNVSKKVSGQYQWIRDLEYVKMVDSDQLHLELIQNMLGLDGMKYTNDYLKQYYGEIQKEIDNGR